MRSRPLIGVVVAAIVGGELFLFLERRQSRGGTGCPLPTEDRGREAMQSAKNLARDDRWVEARDAFRRVYTSYPSQRPIAKVYLDRCELEVTVGRHLLGASRLLAHGSRGAARKELQQIPAETSQVAKRDELLAKIDAADQRVAELVEWTSELRKHHKDRAAMEQLERASQELLELGDENVLANDLAAEASAALEELDTPWLVVERKFKQGDVAGALALARACSKDFQPCKDIVPALQRIAPVIARPEKLSTPKLLQLLSHADEITEEGGEPVEAIVDVLGQRYEAAAVKCRAARDWLCVNKQLALAGDIGAAFDDDSLQEDLERYAKDELMRAYRLSNENPRAARPILQRVRKLTQIDERWADFAQRLEQGVSAGETFAEPPDDAL